MSIVRTNAIVELIDANAPSRLAQLRESFPAYKDLLSPGLTMGDNHAAVPQGVYCELARRGLETAKEQVGAILSDLPRKARLAKRVRLGSAIAAAIASLGAVWSAAVGAAAATIVTAIISFLATIFGMVAGYVETPLFGTSGTTELVEECLRLEIESRNAEIQLERALMQVDANCLDAVSAVNEICAKLRRITIFGDVSSPT